MQAAPPQRQARQAPRIVLPVHDFLRQAVVAAAWKGDAAIVAIYMESVRSALGIGEAQWRAMVGAIGGATIARGIIPAIDVIRRDIVRAQGPRRRRHGSA
jgi:hypothetical protein